MAVFGDKELAEVERWRNVFLRTEGGKLVLEDILNECHVFESIPIDDIGQVQLHNFGTWILYKLGIYKDSNISKILDKFSELPYKE
jgi:hypothetical protein